MGGSPSLQRGKQQDSALQVLLSPNQLCSDSLPSPGTLSLPGLELRRWAGYWDSPSCPAKHRPGWGGGRQSRWPGQVREGPCERDRDSGAAGICWPQSPGAGADAGRWRGWQGTLPPRAQSASLFTKTNTNPPALHDIPGGEGFPWQREAGSAGATGLARGSRRHGTEMLSASFLFFFFPQATQPWPHPGPAPSDPPAPGAAGTRDTRAGSPAKARHRRPQPQASPLSPRSPGRASAQGPARSRGTRSRHGGCRRPGPTERPPFPGLTQLQGRRVAPGTGRAWGGLRCQGGRRRP